MTSRDRTQADEQFVKLDLRALIALRVVLLVAALVSAAYMSLQQGDLGERIGFIYLPISVFLALSAGAAYWLKFHPPGKLLTYSQLLLDVAIITGVVYVTGGPLSPFLFLYLPLVMAASLIFSRGTGFVISAASAAAYLALIGSLLNGWVLPADGSPLVQLPTGGFGLQFIGLCSGMVLVTVLTSFLTKALRVSTLLAEESQIELSQMRQRQHALIDGISDGIVTTDSTFHIVNLNAAASDLLGLSELSVLGRSLLVVLNEVQCDSKIASLLDEDIPEISIRVSGIEQPRRILFYERSIRGVEQEVTGHLFIFQDVTKLRQIEEQLANQERMARLLARDAESVETNSQVPEFLGDSAVMRKVFGLIERVASSDATVLIGGESGTGKELAARAVHQRSHRSRQPFVAVNCGAIPESLIESELFGHKRGSFTGATSDSSGLFRHAEGGTIFLDEIGELPLHMQTKLLRVIQERVVRPVGAERDIPIDVRIIAATNKNLKREVEQGKFRDDLFYRLNVISVKLPPLRERREDIPLLVQGVLSRVAPAGKHPIVSPAALQLLMNYSYPGNIRELENILERALVLGGEVILPEHLPETLMHSPAQRGSAQHTQIIIDESIVLPVDLDMILSGVERRYLEVALLQTQGSKKEASELLGLNMRSLRYRCSKYGLNES